MFAYNIESATAQVDEIMEISGGFIATIDHISHIGGEHEWSAISAKKGMIGVFRVWKIL